MCLQPAGLFTYERCLANWQVIPSESLYQHIGTIIKPPCWQVIPSSSFQKSQDKTANTTFYQQHIGLNDINIDSTINQATRYPIHIGLNDGIISPMEPHGLPTDVETLADILQAAGYSTHAVGKVDFLLVLPCVLEEKLRKVAPWVLQQRLPAD